MPVVSENRVSRRRVQKGVQRILLLLACSGALAADPLAIVKRSLEAEEASWKRDSRYNLVQRVETHDLDGNNRRKETQIRTFRWQVVEGAPFRRLIAQDDKPLTDEQEAREQERFEKAIEERRNESPAERAERLENYEKRRTENRAAVREIPEAFSFRLLGEEVINGRPAYVIEGKPRPGYRHRDRRAKLFTELHGKMWVDKEDFRWVRVEGELADTVTFGWIMVRLHKGSRIRIEQMRLPDGEWVPSNLWTHLSVRLGLIRHVHVEHTADYREYSRAGEAGSVSATLK